MVPGLARLLVTVTLVALAPRVWADERPSAGDATANATQTWSQAHSDQVQQELRDYRAYGPGRPIPTLILDREELRAHLLYLFQAENTLRMQRNANSLAEALGLTGPETTWIDYMLDLMEDNLAGFYTSLEQRLFLLSDTQASGEDELIAHEVFHGIQDQEWGITNLSTGRKWLNDASAALIAVLEGDATLMGFFNEDLVLEGLLRHPSIRAVLLSAMEGLLDSVPEGSTGPWALWAAIAFPYARGPAFILSLYDQGGWEGVDQAYRQPPSSTEQILHPERYLERDEPTWLSFEPQVPIGTEWVVADIMGEYLMSIICAELLGIDEFPACQQAAQGWDGDRLELFEFANDPSRWLFAWVSVWDSVEDAQGYTELMQQLALPWTGQKAEFLGQGAHGEAWGAASEQGFFLIERWGDLALIVVDRGGAASVRTRRHDVERLSNSVWETLQRSAYPPLGSTDLP